MAQLIQSTAYHRMVLMVDSADHVTGKTGLTLTITASKAGAAFASVTPTVTERGDGWYDLALTTTHTNTVGDLAFHITGAGADPTDFVDQVVAAAAAADAALIAAAVRTELTTELGRIDAAMTSRLASASYTAPDNATITAIAGYVDTEVAAIKAKTDLIAGATVVAADIPTANQNADALLDRASAIESGVTVRGALRGLTSTGIAKVSGAGTATNVFRNIGDTKDRVTATVDVDGNRTAVTLDLT